MSRTRSFAEGFEKRCTCFQPASMCRCVYDEPSYRCTCHGGCSLDATVKLEPCSLLPENESLRRRIMELEVLLSRQGFEIPDEVRILQAENCHFRDLTYARLAEVEYWKKMYTNERNANTAKLEAMLKEFQRLFEEQNQKHKKELNDPSNWAKERAKLQADFEEAARATLEAMKKQITDKYKNWISPEQAEELRREIEGLNIKNKNLLVEHKVQIDVLKKNAADATYNALLHQGQVHAQRMKDMQEDYKKIKHQVYADIDNLNKQDKDKLDMVSMIINKERAKHEAAQKELLDKLNMSKSQMQMLMTSNNDKEVAVLKAENADLRKAYEEMHVERDHMFYFAKELVDAANSNQLTKEAAERIIAAHQNDYVKESPTSMKYLDLIHPGLAQAFISVLNNGPKKNDLTINLKSVQSDVPAPLSPTFGPLPAHFKEYNTPEDIANHLSEFSLGSRTPRRENPVPAPQTSEIPGLIRTFSAKYETLV